MPRGIKGSGNAKAGTKTDAKTNRMASVRTENTEGIAQVEPTVAVLDAVKGRKPHPTHEERLAAAEKQIERLTKLNAERTALIEKTESTLNERRAALAKSEAALEAAKAKKERIIEAMNKPVKETKPKLSPEERAQRRRDALAKAREAKKAEKDKYEALLSALAESGKSVDDLLEELKK